MPKIVYSLFSMKEVGTFAIETLKGLSPVGHGDDPHIGLYRASHLMFLNGHVVEDASAWKPGDELEIANPIPYARLIEVGILKMRVPGSDHVYQQSETIIRAKYGSVVSVQFKFMPVRFASAQAVATFRRIEGKDRATSRSALKQQPALILSALN